MTALVFKAVHDMSRNLTKNKDVRSCFTNESVSNVKMLDISLSVFQAFYPMHSR